MTLAEVSIDGVVLVIADEFANDLHDSHSISIRGPGYASTCVSTARLGNGVTHAPSIKEPA